MARGGDRRILFVKLGAIGDAIQSAVALHEYRARNPGVMVDWVVGQNIRPLIDAIGVADKVIPVDESALLAGGLPSRFFGLMKGVARVHAEGHRRYESVFTVYEDWRYQLLTRAIVTGARRSLSRARARPNNIHHRNRVHEIFRLLSGGDPEIFDIAAATRATGERLERNVRLDDVLKIAPPYVAVAAGGAKNLHRDDALRRWPIGSYRNLVERLILQGLEVVLVGARGDSWVSGELKGLPVIDLIGKTDLLQLFGVLSRAACIVSNDSGVLHLASLTRAGLIGLFGPTPANAVLPLGRQNTEAIALGNKVSCSPCYDGRNYAACGRNVCLESITVESVLAAIDRVSVEGASS